jgi:chemotaxis protein methyltransferase CheR
MKKEAIETIEMEMLLEAVFERYGHDFRQYSKKSLYRQLERALVSSDCVSIGELMSKLLHDPTVFNWFRQKLMLHTTAFFRAPGFYKLLRESVFPYLATSPYFDIWSAGCSTGEEPYSLAIALEQCNLLKRVRIFATDYSDEAIARAKSGIFDLGTIKTGMGNFDKSGLEGSFSDYVHVKHGKGIIKKRFRDKITFANHNLTTDGSFGTMKLIVCRNVMIYFDGDLKDRVFDTFNSSLSPNGIFCIGGSESLTGSKISNLYKAVDSSQKIYKKVS